MELIHLDDVLAVVNKPAGLMVHDSALARGETDFAADRLRELLGRRIHLIHRLDRATSGCLLLAFEREVAADLGRQFMSRAVRKRYLAVCRGWPAHETFVVEHALDGGPGKPEKKPATTRFTRLACGELQQPAAGFPTSRYGLLECEPETGRFRQIRRHLKHVDHHLVGDTSHGDGRRNLQFRRLGVHRMLLHAWKLHFVHPVSGRAMQVGAPLDPEWQRVGMLFDWDLARFGPTPGASAPGG
jgi:tRNA pseudouridine65 synthase